jgi:hypothetical protein
MRQKNNLKTLLEEAGIKTLTPTDNVLKSKLEGMTIRRFNKILNNSPSLTPITATEANNLIKWVAGLLNKSVSEVNLFDSVVEEALTK